jgi:hypothetical protein
MHVLGGALEHARATRRDLLNFAIALCTICALLVSMVVVTLFLGAFVRFHVSLIIATAVHLSRCSASSAGCSCSCARYSSPPGPAYRADRHARNDRLTGPGRLADPAGRLQSSRWSSSPARRRPAIAAAEHPQHRIQVGGSRGTASRRSCESAARPAHTWHRPASSRQTATGRRAKALPALAPQRVDAPMSAASPAVIGVRGPWRGRSSATGCASAWNPACISALNTRACARAARSGGQPRPVSSHRYSPIAIDSQMLSSSVLQHRHAAGRAVLRDARLRLGLRQRDLRSSNGSPGAAAASRDAATRTSSSCCR